MARAKKTRISVLNWMGTLLLCAIPGVNIIALICFLIFAKSPSKKSFAQAALLWMVIVAVLVVAALLALPEQVSDLAGWLRENAAPQQTFEAVGEAPEDGLKPSQAPDTASPEAQPSASPAA